MNIEEMFTQIEGILKITKQELSNLYKDPKNQAQIQRLLAGWLAATKGLLDFAFQENYAAFFPLEELTKK